MTAVEPVLVEKRMIPREEHDGRSFGSSGGQVEEGRLVEHLRRCREHPSEVVEEANVPRGSDVDQLDRFADGDR